MKRDWWIATCLVIGFGIMGLVMVHEKHQAFQSPLDALNHVQDSSLKLGDIINVHTLKQYNLAFIFFYYTEENKNDSLGVATFKKGFYGWKFVKMNKAGKLTGQDLNALKTAISLNDVGLKDAYYWVGITDQGVDRVKVGDQNATMIPLKNSQDQNIFAFLSLASTNEKVITFLDKQGEGILNQTY